MIISEFSECFKILNKIKFINNINQIFNLNLYIYRNIQSDF